MSQLNIWQEEYNDELFPGVFKADLRTQYLSRWFADIGQVVNLENADILLVTGMLNIGVSTIGLYLISKRLKLSLPQTVVFTAVFFFSIGLFWQYNDTGYTLFSLADMTINAFYPQILGIGLMLIILDRMYDLFESDRHLPRRIAAVVLMLFIILISHLFTAGVTLMMMGIFCFSKILEDRKYLKLSIIIGISCLAMLVASLALPNFNWLSYVLDSASNLQSSPIGLGTADEKYFSIPARASILGIALISLPAVLYKKTDNFMRIWLAVLIFVSLSFFLPFKIPYFWRFTNFIRIPLAYLSALVFGTKNLQTTVAKAFFLGFIMIGSLGLLERNMGTYDDTQLISFIGAYNDTTILADPIESNYIIGATNSNVIAIPNGHITSPDILAINLERLGRLKRYYEGNIGELESIVDE